MADNATGFDTVAVNLKEVNQTVNATLSWLPGASFIAENLDFCLIELKLVISALGIIYVGSHAALRRPPSAALVSSKKGSSAKERRKEREEENYTQGLMPSDAIMFPIMAGVILVSLYYLIQWLQDPAILNKILRWYMSIMAIASLLTMYAHGSDLIVSFIFPRYWRGRDGKLRKISQTGDAVVRCDDVGNSLDGSGLKESPCLIAPGFLIRSEKTWEMIWGWRRLLTRGWMVKLYIPGVVAAAGHFNLGHIWSVPLAVATTIVYFSTNWTFLSNVLGYGMCYGSFLLISPTDFLTSSLVLSGLFFYDIFMVFYTPYMVTVATKLDVPIKLTFETASRSSILGLGDIVIPGMVIAWALRFDLWAHYLRKVKYEKKDVKIIEKDEKTGKILTRSETQHMEVKAPYENAKGWWCERLWIRGINPCSTTQQLPVDMAGARFAKTYFYASMIGYLTGMVVTLAMLLVFRHGQPALLYLVPGVLGSIILTAAVRGELKKLWNYTEDGTLDTVDEIVVLDESGQATQRIGEMQDGVVDLTKKKDDADKNKEEEGDKKDKDAKEEAEAKNEDGPTIDRKKYAFLISIEPPQ